MHGSFPTFRGDKSRVRFRVQKKNPGGVRALRGSQVKRIVPRKLFPVVTGGCVPVTDQSDSPKSRVIAGESDVLEFGDQLDNRWTDGWTAPLNPLRGLSFGDHRPSHESVIPRV